MFFKPYMNTRYPYDTHIIQFAQLIYRNLISFKDFELNSKTNLKIYIYIKIENIQYLYYSFNINNILFNNSYTQNCMINLFLFNINYILFNNSYIQNCMINLFLFNNFIWKPFSPVRKTSIYFSLGRVFK